MPGLEYGYRRVILEIVGGVITSIVINEFIKAGFLDASLILYFKILNLLALVGLLTAMPYWVLRI